MFLEGSANITGYLQRNICTSCLCNGQDLSGESWWVRTLGLFPCGMVLWKPCTGLARPPLHHTAKQDQPAAAFPSCQWALFESLCQEGAAFWRHKLASLTLRWVVTVTLSWKALLGAENISKQGIQHLAFDSWDGSCKVATALEGLGPAARELERPASTTTPLAEGAETWIRWRPSGWECGETECWNGRALASVRLSWLANGWGGRSVCECSRSSCWERAGHPDERPQQGFIWPAHKTNAALWLAQCVSPWPCGCWMWAGDLPTWLLFSHVVYNGMLRNSGLSWCNATPSFFLTPPSGVGCPGTASRDEMMLWGHASPSAPYWVPSFSVTALEDRESMWRAPLAPSSHLSILKQQPLRDPATHVTTYIVLKFAYMYFQFKEGFTQCSPTLLSLRELCNPCGNKNLPKFPEYFFFKKSFIKI